ncbi:uncharacterized protein A4U43_C03F19400 [Asparagus officinalis]|uniref:Sulfotransferase n=1 Tax=Asparagus officinalis TaxID=4686 RepID=A0A5P1FBD3_ASPOF|nr:uncharacterized protein LOC109834038 [Asparagus officinalis]ONK75678.1 uncharacterized protein A4U43_C03F19400 [Asparagus officinalis]
MGGDFYLIPKDTLITRLPRRSPSTLRMIMLAVVMMCSIYISSICLKQTRIHIKHETKRTKPLERYSYDAMLVGLKQTEDQITREVLMKKRPVEEHNYDPEKPIEEHNLSVKKTEHQIKPELLRTNRREGYPSAPGPVTLEQPVTQTKLEIIRAKPVETYNQKIVGLTQEETKSTNTIGQHSYDSSNRLNQTEIHINQEPAETKPIEPHSSVSAIVTSEQPKILINPPKDQQTYDRSINIHLNKTTVLVKPKLARVEPPQCVLDPEVPQSEIPYLHFPVPTNYRRRECACTSVRFFVIMSSQRSGTKWLESLLNSHINISSNGEIFLDRKMCANASIISRQLDTVYNLEMEHTAARSQCTSAVGFKWMLNQGLMEHRREVFNYFKQKGVLVIFLFRRNQLRRMISLLANDQDPTLLNGTHKAHVISKQEAEILANYKPKLDPRNLVARLKREFDIANEAVGHFKSIRNMFLYYEDLIQNNTQKLNEVMDFLHVPRQPLHSGHVKIHTRPLSQMVRNWSAVRKALRGSQYEKFLTSEK